MHSELYLKMMIYINKSNNKTQYHQLKVINLNRYWTEFLIVNQKHNSIYIYIIIDFINKCCRVNLNKM